MNNCFSGKLDIWVENSIKKGVLWINDSTFYDLSIEIVDDIIINDNVFGVMIGGKYLYYNMPSSINSPIIKDNSIIGFKSLTIQEDGLELIIYR